MSTLANVREFLTEQSSGGGIDLFRRSPGGFVLVDTFDTEADAQTYVATLPAAPLKSGTQARFHEAA